MRALFWHDLRALLPWGALCLVACALAMGYAATSMELFKMAPNQAPLTDRTMLLATMLGGVLSGIPLGLIQLVPELAPGRWALLIHRPLSPNRIFWSKVAAGLLLYSAAVGLPFAAVVWWSATRVPVPFDGRLALGGLVNLLGGIPCYFAALLVALRPSARWLGSRALPLATALLGTSCVAGSEELWQALVVLGVVIVLLAVSAWASFLSGIRPPSPPDFSGRRWLLRPGTARPALALCLLLGLYGLGVGLGNVTGDTSRLVPGRELVAILKEAGDLERLKEGSPGSFWDANRIFVPVPDYHAATGEDDVHWYYRRDAGQLVGYDRYTASIVGRIGAQGFRSLGPVRPFEGTLRYLNRGWLVLDTAAYRLDLKQRTVRKVADAKTLGPVRMATANRFYNVAAESELLLATNDAIVVVNEEGKRRVSLPLSLPGGCAGVAVTRAQNPAHSFPSWGDYLAVVWPCAWQGTMTLSRYSADGRSIGQKAEPFTHAHEWGLNHGVIAGLAPSFVFAGWLLTGTELPPRDLPRTWGSALFVLLGLWSVAGGAICLWLTRRYAFLPGPRLLWTVLCLVVGLPGILVLLASHEGSARLPCHRCGRPWSVTLDSCPHCGARPQAALGDGPKILAAS